MTTTKTECGLIYELMPKVMADIPTISKDRKNTGQGYSFRGIDDAYNLIHPVLVKHGVVVPMEVVGSPVVTPMTSKSGGMMTNIVVHLRARFTAKDGSFVTSEAIGQGMDQGDKAAAKAQSMAIKQIFFETFAIPTDDPKDAEEDNPEPIAAAECDDFLSAPPAPSTPPPPSKFDGLPDFTKAKKSLGDETYYAILGQYGVEHAIELPAASRAGALKVMRDAFRIRNSRELAS